jgi:RNA polymerase sigma-54 factor
VYTPQGIYELKYFFNSSLPGANGETVASESVKEKIRQLIAREDPRRPLSDQEITELLQKEKIHIARRTVAKYRELLTILPSSKRRNPNFVPPPPPPGPAASGPEEEDLLDD